MQKLTSIFLALTISALSLSAGNGIDDRNKKKTDDTKKKKNDDTTQVVVSKKTLGISDSLIMFPSHDLYCSWDTSVIHPYYFDKEFMGDSVTINLLDDYNCGFTMPWKGPITSGYGWRRRRAHWGTDINLETGDTVVAAFEGKVRIAKMNKGYGNVVIIRHKNGLETVYAHLSKLLVQPDQDVKSGEIIGLGGNTGHSYGSHLHFEMRYLGKSIDTEDLVDYDKWELKNSTFVLYKEDFNARYDLHNVPTAKSKTTKKSHVASASGSKKAKTKFYVVKKGDSLGKIAQRNHISLKALCAKNGIKPHKTLKAGQKLKI
jgi:murein DD-endopeptidase MepM/ murein hydrolase activator NlpD